MASKAAFSGTVLRVHPSRISGELPELVNEVLRPLFEVFEFYQLQTPKALRGSATQGDEEAVHVDTGAT